MYFSKQLELIEDLFSHGCFVSAHAEVKKLEQFTAMFAERAMEGMNGHEYQNTPIRG